MGRFRSDRERLTYTVCLFAAFFAIVIVPIIFEYSTALALAVHVFLPAAGLVALIVWERWGRRRFPLKSEPRSA